MFFYLFIDNKVEHCTMCEHSMCDDDDDKS